MAQAALATESVADSETEIEIRRTFQAPRDIVYAAWSDPRQLVQWWGPEGMTVPTCDWQAVEGQRWRTCMQAPDGQQYCVGGEFREVTPPERLVFTWTWESESEGATAGLETLVSVEFSEQGEATEVCLRHLQLRDRETCEGHLKGWTSSFGCLARLV